MFGFLKRKKFENLTTRRSKHTTQERDACELGPNTRPRGPETARATSRSAARGHIASLSRSVPTGTRVRQGFRWPPLLRVAIEHGAVHAGERAYK